jgi:SAM-dependent methyltransferase
VSTDTQSEHYGEGYDYLGESPHLKHRHLYSGLTTRVADAVEATARPAPEVLEIGAGDGSVTEFLLARGYRVTATEMSRESVEAMQRRFGTGERFRALHDPGDLSSLGDSRFDAILFASVLHHIPDYESAVRHAVDSHLRAGGSFVSIQDPPWYPRMNPLTKSFSDVCYLSWRLTQGELLRGLKTRTRRRFSGLSEEAPSDVVEYHVVRNGVDEEALTALLAERFGRVETVRYWSSQGSPQQRLGERLSLTNTFALFATEAREGPAA